MLEESDGSDDDELRRQLRREHMRMQQQDAGRLDGSEMEGQEDDANFLDIEDHKGSLIVWLKQPRTISWVTKQFSDFLRVFKENNSDVYEQKIIDMCTNNR